jgi:hypothetical protein
VTISSLKGCLRSLDVLLFQDGQRPVEQGALFGEASNGLVLGMLSLGIVEFRSISWEED